jgi:single-stranded-DNA-specific exonuclease
LEKKWNIHQADGEQAVASLKQALGVEDVIARLLVLRGIHTFEESKTFFRPTLDMLHDPFLMKDMDIAIDRIVKAIAANEKVLIFGDYDVDGTTSGLQLFPEVH